MKKPRSRLIVVWENHLGQDLERSFKSPDRVAMFFDKLRRDHGTRQAHLVSVDVLKSYKRGEK
jgi:hypothetical protein